MSALKVIVKQDRDSLVQFIIRLSSVIAGIIVISGSSLFPCSFSFLSQNNFFFYDFYLYSGYLNSLIQFFVDFVIKKVSPQTYQQMQSTQAPQPTVFVPSSTIPTESQQPQRPAEPNNLISNANKMLQPI